MTHGRLDEADSLLKQFATRPDVDQIEVRFLQGMLAVQRGDLNRAIKLFGDILSEKPDLVRARLELARAMFLKKDDEAAQRQFERVLAADLPLPVRRNVERWINAIRERRGWSADFYFALAPDSNVNNGSSVGEVTLGGMPFVLDDAAKEQSGVGVVMGLQGTRILNFGSEQMKGRLSGAVSTRAYTETSDYNDTTVDLRAGPLFMLRNGEVAVELLSTGRWYGQHDLYDGYGVGVTGRTRLGKRCFVTGLAEAREQRRLPGPERPGCFFRQGVRLTVPACPLNRYGRAAMRPYCNDGLA